MLKHNHLDLTSAHRTILHELRDALVRLDVIRCYEIINALKDVSIDVKTLMSEVISPAFDEIGKRYERGEYYIADLIIASEILKELNILIKSKLSRCEETGIRVVLGVVRGDIHDLGKDIVASVLSAYGFEVIDLGVDVPAERFVEAVETYRPHVLGLSAFLTTTAIEIKNVIDLLKSRGLRDKVKVIIGGAATSESLAREFGADAYARDAFQAVEILRGWFASERNLKGYVMCR